MCVVDTIADDENVGYRETGEIRINCHLAAARLVDKRTGEDTRHLSLAEQVARVKKRAPCIYDVVNKQYDAACKVQLCLTNEAHVTRTLSSKTVAA